MSTRAKKMLLNVLEEKPNSPSHNSLDALEKISSCHL